MEQQTETRSGLGTGRQSDGITDRRSDRITDRRSDRITGRGSDRFTGRGSERITNENLAMGTEGKKFSAYGWMNRDIQTNFGPCGDVTVYTGADTFQATVDTIRTDAAGEMNVGRSLLYTALIFLALCVVSYIASV